METKTKANTSRRNGILMLMIIILQSNWLNASQLSITKKLGISSNEMNSVYILGGVLVLGIVGYFVYSMIDKNRKQDKPSNRRPVSHSRHHHQHRVIKKSS